MPVYKIIRKADGVEVYRYDAADAARDFASVWSELNRHSLRMDGLEARRR